MYEALKLLRDLARDVRRGALLLVVIALSLLAAGIFAAFLLAPLMLLLVLLGMREDPPWLLPVFAAITLVTWLQFLGAADLKKISSALVR
ncbi:hypothetical protein D3C73_1446830 [compost metagenome]